MNPSFNYSQGVPGLSQGRPASMIGAANLIDAADGEFAEPALGITFRGRYAVVSFDETGTCSALYLGEGSKLSLQGYTLSSASAPTTLTLPTGKRVTSQLPDGTTSATL
ncbi:MAG: hypothetical protein EXS41_10985 [Opitutaceae bacterium]|nr:hypothetical protein [Opitutaceae bacterium]